MTMVEAALSLVFFGLVLGVSFVLCRVGWDSWSTNSARVIMVENLRKVQAWMAIDLSQAGAVTISDVPADGTWYHAISFQRASTVTNGAIVWGEVMSYALGGSHGDQLVRTSSGGANPVAVNIVSFDLRRQTATPNIIEAHVSTHQKTGRSADEDLTKSLDFMILMRN